jgi:hypothetical protein
MTPFELLVLLSPWLALMALIVWDSTKRPIKIVVASKRRFDRALVNWTRVLSISTVGLVVATIVSAVILYRTDEAIHQQLQVLERDEQPYVQLTSDIAPPEFRVMDRNEGFVYWPIQFVNEGKRPATQFSIRKFIKVGDGKFNDKEGVYDGTRYLEAHVPGVFNIVDNGKISADRFQELMKQDKGIIAFVEFTYSDPIERKHKTEFCLAHFNDDTIIFLDPKDCKKELP